MKKYIGVENELLTFQNGEYKKFKNSFFKKLKTKNCFSINKTQIITETGNKYYIDLGGIIETVTPPIEINKGFSTRVMNSILLGRNNIAENFPEFDFTGFSMHWNLSRKNICPNQTYKILAVPFHLFGINPLSVGFNLRDKPDVYELLGDSLMGRKQINATALLFGTYSIAMEKEEFPLNLKGEFQAYQRTDFFLDKGRKTFIQIQEGKRIHAQTYLLKFYQWLNPFIREFGTLREQSNLEKFVYGKLELEMDKIEFFERLRKAGGKNKEFYQPIKGKGSPIIKIEKGIRVPKEGKEIGAILSEKRKIDNFDFGSLRMKKEYFTKFQDFEEMYKYGKKLRKSKPALLKKSSGKIS